MTRKARLRKSKTVGKLRLHRLYLEELSRKELPNRIRNAQARARKIRRVNYAGRKILFWPSLHEANIRTPYGARTITRRRAANKVARRSRKANR